MSKSEKPEKYDLMGDNPGAIQTEVGGELLKEDRAAVISLSKFIARNVILDYNAQLTLHELLQAYTGKTGSYIPYTVGWIAVKTIVDTTHPLGAGELVESEEGNGHLILRWRLYGPALEPISSILFGKLHMSEFELEPEQNGVNVNKVDEVAVDEAKRLSVSRGHG